MNKDNHAILEITVREGRNRQVRKMCDAIGHPVTQLTRVAFGPIHHESPSERVLMTSSIAAASATVRAIGPFVERRLTGRDGPVR